MTRLRFANWSLRLKVAVLLVVALLLPLGFAAYEEIRESRRQLLTATEDLLGARGDQLVAEVDAFHAGYQRAAAALARLPRIVAFCQSIGPAMEALADLDIQPAADSNIRGVAILDHAGIVQLATERQLVGKDLSATPHVAEALRGAPVTSDIHVASPDVGATPSIAYLHTVAGSSGFVVVLWVRAQPLWEAVRASHALAGAGSFAVMLDRNGIRLAHTTDQGMVFHPAAPLDPALIDALVAEHRFGESTRALLEDVRSFPEEFTHSRAATIDPTVYRGVSPRTHKWNYGLSRRLQTVQWTFCFNVPEELIDAQIAARTRSKVFFAGGMMLAAVFVAMLFATVIVDPVLRLTRATEVIGGGDLTARVVVDRTDELGRLGASFNTMASRVESQAEALENARDGLERTVAERTAELHAEIVERRRVEEDLRITLQSIGDAVIATDVDGRITRMNPVAERLTGWTIDEARGSKLDTVFRIVNEDTRRVVESPVDHVIREGIIVGLANHTVLIAKDGSERAIADSGAPIRDDDGKLCGVVLVFHDQSVERKAERALERSEARFRRLSEAGIIGITISDPNGTIRETNDAFLAMLGYSREEFVAGMVSREKILDPTRSKEDIVQRNRLSAAGVVHPWQTRLVHKNGTRVPILAGAARVDESSDESIAFILDLTEQKRAEAALQLSERRFRGFKESGVIGIVLADNDGNITEVNDAFLSIVGYTQEDVIAGRVNGRTLNTPERELTDAAARIELQTTGVAHAWEKELVRKDGTRVPVLMGIVMLDEETQESVAFALDLTARKRAEAAGRESEARKAAVMEAALDAIVVMNHDGRISDFNPAAERTFGYARSDVLGKLLADVLVPEPLRDRHRAGLERYLTTGQKSILGRRIEVTAIRKSGESFPAEVAVVRIRSEGPPVFTGYIRDITDRRQAAEAELLRREKEVAETANRELEAFSYSVAHDLRAPLRGICGFSSVLLEDYGHALDATAEGHLQRIIGAGDRMGQIIDTLLSLARLSRTAVRRETVNLTELARAVIDEIRASEPNRTVDFVVADDIVARGDPGLLRTVLENLLGNAFKFTRNEPAPRIELGANLVNDTLHYFVRDNGAGFDMAYASRLFAPFQRLHSAEQFEGSGVGLATVQRIVLRHGGRVWAEGRENQGATFNFTLVEERPT